MHSASHPHPHTEQHYIGLMSGTSLDGVDAVLIRMRGQQWDGAWAHTYLPYSGSLKQRILALQQVGADELHHSRMLAQDLSRLSAQAVQQLLQQQQLTPDAIRAIGCHGQTIRHAPQHGYSIQLADWALLAELCGIMVIGDFRSGDLAAGGQGAPLVPAFHQAVFADPAHTRVVLNLGGIANISILRPGQAALGFDTGPGNMLMDAWVQTQWQQPYDAAGHLAAQGQVLPDLLHTLLAHPYFRQPAPKSTGRELFSLPWLSGQLHGTENPHDVLRTLLEYSAATVAMAIKHEAPDAKQLFVCGGGIENTLLCTRIQEQLPELTLHSTAELALHPQWVEAAAFAWLAACWLDGTPSNSPAATGAVGPRILGAAYRAAPLLNPI